MVMAVNTTGPPQTTWRPGHSEACAGWAASSGVE